MSNIVLKNWYQLDFKIKNPVKDLKKIDSIMEELKSINLISKWFFLFETPNKTPTIRARMRSLKRAALKKKITWLADKKNLVIYDKKPFKEYVEGSDALFNEEVVRRFANIMSEITKITIKKLKRQTQFSNYRVMERISHCLFNNMGTFACKSEKHFLTQRLLERTGGLFDEDFESKMTSKENERRF